MMKQIYNKPQTEVTHVCIQSRICAGSVTGGVDPNNPTFNNEGEEAKIVGENTSWGNLWEE